MRSGKASGCTAWSGRMIEMGIFRKYVSQTRKPEGIPGKMMIKGMNFGHVKMEDWGMDHLKTISPKEIIDIGCGGGRNAGELLKRYPGAKVTAVDYSSLSVEQAAEYNKNAVAAGRCVVKQGDVSELELDEGRYGLATAFETIYFWPGLEKCFREVAKVLKEGGVFMIVNESDGKDALRAAGFSKVKTSHHKSKSWITVLARK